MGKPDKGDEDLDRVVKAATQSIFTEPDTASVKRVAWAYSLSKPQSEDEARLLKLLREKLAEVA